MRAPELVEFIAGVTGEPVNSVKVADRALAEAGLRTKGKGRTPPPVSRQDAIRLLLGIFGSPALSRCDAYVSNAVKFKFAGVDDPRHPDEMDLSAALKKIIGLTTADLKNLDLLTVLARVSDFLEGERYDAHLPNAGSGIWLKIEQNDRITLQFEDNDLSISGGIVFSGLTDTPRPIVRKLAIVPGRVLVQFAEIKSNEAGIEMDASFN